MDQLIGVSLSHIHFWYEVGMLEVPAFKRLYAQKTLCRNCSREREGLYNGNVLLAHLCTAVLIGSMRRTLCSKLFMMRA